MAAASAKLSTSRLDSGPEAVPVPLSASARLDHRGVIRHAISEARAARLVGNIGGARSGAHDSATPTGTQPARDSSNTSRPADVRLYRCAAGCNWHSAGSGSTCRSSARAGATRGIRLARVRWRYVMDRTAAADNSGHHEKRDSGAKRQAEFSLMWVRL